MRASEKEGSLLILQRVPSGVIVSTSQLSRSRKRERRFGHVSSCVTGVVLGLAVSLDQYKRYKHGSWSPDRRATNVGGTAA